MTAAGRWEHFHHEADVGVRGIGASPAQAFEQAAVAMTAVITEPERVQPRETVQIELDCADRELMFTEWLNALVYEMATRRMLFSRFAVRIEGEHLAATAAGEGVDVLRHQPAVEVKGATLTQLRVAQEPDGTWVAQCVVDV
jgi:tRNA nucleotidyltransferase (CCA-adding enzyme)